MAEQWVIRDERIAVSTHSPCPRKRPENEYDGHIKVLGGLKKICDSRDYLAVSLQQLKYFLYGRQKSVTVHYEFLPSQTYPDPQVHCYSME